MARPETIQITYGGKPYNGAFRIEGGKVCVESAYGSKAVKLQDPEAAKEQALEAFRGIVRKWRPGRAHR